MPDTSGYPYDNSVYSNMPYGGGADSSFVISATPQGGGQQTKRWIIISLVLVLLLSFVVSLVIVQKRQSVADIRNYAQEEGSGPQKSFGGLFTTPANIAAERRPACAPGETSANCQTAQTTIVAVALTSTPTPTRALTVMAKIKSILIPSSTPTPTPVLASTPTFTPTPTHVQSSSLPQSTVTSTPTPTQIVQPSAVQTAAEPTATPVPVLSCQKVELFLGSQNITQEPSVIRHGDTIRFIGYVTNIGRGVESMTFRLMINDELREEKKVPAVLSGSAWVGQYEHTFDQYAKHRVTLVSVTPKE